MISEVLFDSTLESIDSTPFSRVVLTVYVNIHTPTPCLDNYWRQRIVFSFTEVYLVLEGYYNIIITIGLHMVMCTHSTGKIACVSVQYTFVNIVVIYKYMTQVRCHYRRMSVITNYYSKHMEHWQCMTADDIHFTKCTVKLCLITTVNIVKV